MNHYPIKTRRHPTGPPEQQTEYAHDNQRQPVNNPENCRLLHQTLRSAYGCGRNTEEVRPILAMNPDIPLQRAIGPDELALNGLIRPTRKNYALSVDLQVREIPIYEGRLKNPTNEPPLRPGGGELEYSCYSMFMLLRKTLQVLDFYTTPAPPGLFTNEFTRILPTELLPTYQEMFEASIEQFLVMQNIYNQLVEEEQSNKRKSKEDSEKRGALYPIDNILSYRLQPYR